MKRILSFVLVMAVVASLTVVTGCGKKEFANGELNFFNWTEYMPESVLKDFSKEYNIKVNYTTFSSNEEMLAKVKSGKEGTYDLTVASDYMADKMINDGMLEKVDMSEISNFGNIKDTYKKMYYDPTNEYTVPFMISNAILCYNKKKIPEGIKYFNDIFKPKYKNSIVSIDDERMVIGMAAIAAGESINEKDPTKLEKIKAKLISLKPNIKVFDSDSPKSSMISGETSIGYVWCAEAALAMKENKDIVPVYPEEGLCLMIDNMVIPKNAKNKKNAELFMNYFLRPEVSKKFSDAYPYVNPNKEAAPLMSDEYKNNPASNPSDETMSKGQLLQNLGTSAKAYDDIWTEFKNK